MPSLVAAGLTAMSAAICLAQTEYHDLEGGRPTYIEEAAVIPRYAFEWEMAPLRVDDFGKGLTRFQIEPALSYGILPRTDIEVTAPIIFRERGATPARGLTGLGFGAAYSFNPESVVLPALAIKGNVSFPGAGATTVGTLFAARALATRTFGSTRLHLNIEFSTYRVATQSTATGCGAPCQAAPAPIPDTPCGVLGLAPSPENPRAAPGDSIAGHFIPGQPTGQQQAGGPTQTGGTLLVFGLAADRTIPLSSMLVAADVYATRYTGALPRPNDWIGEIGIRKQISPRTVLDVGAGRRFAGLRLAWIATVGTTYTFGVPAFTSGGGIDAPAH